MSTELNNPDFRDALQEWRKQGKKAIRALIRAIGDDPDREGLLDTPDRVLKAWAEDWGRGYGQDDPACLLKLFEPENSYYGSSIHPTYNEMVVVRDINMFSHCEHHMTPFFGVAHIAYVPSDRGLVGLSKLARIVDHFSRRLQVQERMTVQIADCLATHLSPHIGVTIEARHMCMISRGVRQQNATTITTALRGAIYDDALARAEFFNACRSK